MELYGARLYVSEIALRVTVMAFAAAQGVVIAVLWVLGVVAPWVRVLADRVTDQIAAADLVMEEVAEGPWVADTPPVKPVPVVDGDVMWTRTEGEERP